MTSTVSNMTSQAWNDSSSPLQDPSGELLAYICAEIVIAILAFFNNIFVLIAIYKFKNLQTSTYWLVANLAVADIAIALIAIPSAIVLRIGLAMSSDSGNSQVVSREACLVIVSSVLFLTQVSIFNLLAIAIDRFIAIYFCLRYRAIVTSFRVKVCIGGIWVLGALIGFVPQAGWNAVTMESQWSHNGVNAVTTESTNSSYSAEMKHCVFEEVISMEYMVFFNFFGCVLLPLTLMFVLYIFIFKSAKKQLKKIYSDVSLEKKRTSKSSLASLKDYLHIKQSIFSPKTKASRSLRTRVLNIKTKTTKEDKDYKDSKNDSIAVSDSKSIGEDSAIYNSTICQVPACNSPANEGTSITLTLPDAGNTERRNTETQNEVLTNCPSKLSPIIPQSKNYALDVNQDDISRTSTLSRDTNIPLNNHRSLDYKNGIAEIGRLPSDASSIVTIRSGSAATEGDIARRKFRRRSKYLRKEFKAARSLFTVVGVFAICWLPLHLHNTITQFRPDINQPEWFTDFAILLSHANSLVNPIIYAFRLHDMKIAFQKIIRKHIWATLTSSLRCCKTT